MKLSKPQQTILVIILGMVVLYFAHKWKGFLIIAAILLLIGLISPLITQTIHGAWMKLGHALGYVNNRILLTIVFFVILTPMAVIGKMFGRTNMKLRPKNASSMFNDRNHLFAKKDLEDIW